jgi:hypothetical protein
LDIFIANGKLFTYSDIIFSKNVEISIAIITIFSPNQAKIFKFAARFLIEPSEIVVKLCVSDALKLSNRSLKNKISLSIKHQVICEATSYLAMKL